MDGFHVLQDQDRLFEESVIIELFSAKGTCGVLVKDGLSQMSFKEAAQEWGFDALVAAAKELLGTVFGII